MFLGGFFLGRGYHFGSFSSILIRKEGCLGAVGGPSFHFSPRRNKTGIVDHKENKKDVSLVEERIEIPREKRVTMIRRTEMLLKLATRELQEDIEQVKKEHPDLDEDPYFLECDREIDETIERLEEEWFNQPNPMTGRARVELSDRIAEAAVNIKEKYIKKKSAEVPGFIPHNKKPDHMVQEALSLLSKHGKWSPDQQEKSEIRVTLEQEPIPLSSESVKAIQATLKRIETEQW